MTCLDHQQWPALHRPRILHGCVHAGCGIPGLLSSSSGVSAERHASPHAGISTPLSRRQALFAEAGFNATYSHAGLLQEQYIPVVASVAADHTGQALNVNADIAAGEVGNECAHPAQTVYSCCLGV